MSDNLSLCTYIAAPRHRDFGTGEFHHPYSSFRHADGARLSGESPRASIWKEDWKLALEKPLLQDSYWSFMMQINFTIGKNKGCPVFLPVSSPVRRKELCKSIPRLSGKTNIFIYIFIYMYVRSWHSSFQDNCALFSVQNQLWPSPGSGFPHWNGISQYTMVILAPVSLQQL